MDTLKPHSNGPLYSNTVIGILAVDGWAVTFGTARRCLAGRAQIKSNLIVSVACIARLQSSDDKNNKKQ